jgi:hypothetical protein
MYLSNQSCHVSSNEMDTTEERRSFHTALPGSLVRRVKAVAALENRDVADITAVALSRYIADRLPLEDRPTRFEREEVT